MKTRTKALLLAATLGWPGWGMPLTAEDLPGAASPQEVMKRSWEAAAAGEEGASYNLTEPVFRRQLAIAKLVTADRQIHWDEREVEALVSIAAQEDHFTDEQRAEAARAGEKKTAQLAERRRLFTALLERTGVAPHLPPGTRLYDLPEETVALLLEKVDQGKLIAALDAHHLALYPETALPRSPLTRVEATDYRITGDRATAKVGDHVVEFVRVDGRWYFAPPPMPKVVEPKCGVPPRGRL